MHICGIELKAPLDNAIKLKLVRDGRTIFQPSTIEKGQPLTWTNTSIDIRSDSIIDIRIEKRKLRIWNKLVTFKIPPEDVERVFSGSQREIRSFDKGCELIIKFTSDADDGLGSSNQRGSTHKTPQPPQNDLDVAMQVVDAQRGSLLEELGRARVAVETIVEIVETVADVHPFAKLASLAVTAAFNHLKKEEENDQNLIDLVHDMNHALSFVTIVEGRAKIEKLKLIVKEMMELVKNASHFIVDYFSNGRLNRILRSAFLSTAPDRIADFIKCFEKLRKGFSDGVTVQVLDLFCNFEEDRRIDTLRRVIPSQCKPSYNSDRGCMDGTRVDILNEIIEWAINSNSPHHLLWLHGLAGTGKSAIANSVCHTLNDRADGRQYLGASFFCKRDDKYLRNPTLVLPKIAANLASLYPAYGKLVAAALLNDPDLAATEAMTRQFTNLFKGPFVKLSESNRDTLVIVVDALDEMGTDDDRRRLITILYEMSELVPWLKIILTSRPDPDIRRFFERPKRTFRDFDLNTHGSYDDILTVTRARMRDIAVSKDLGSDWPGEGKILALARRGMPLFIWVEVAASFIKGSMEPNKRLEHLLTTDSTGSSYARLDSLYTAAIENFFGGEDNASIFRDIIGMVVVVSFHAPLPCSALTTLVKYVDWSAGECAIDGPTVERVMDALGSVLYEDTTNNRAIRICHPSFMDFLTKSDRGCPARFRIDIRHENVRMAAFCLRTMIDEQVGLKFNICGLESSYKMNVDIEGLSGRVRAAVSESLRYSCLYWAAHLADAVTDDNKCTKLYQLLKQFFYGGRSLFWLEVLSLIGEVKVAITSLLLVVAWIDDLDDEYSRQAADLHRFVLTFFHPISQSTPHIYVSALAFSPNQSVTSQQFLPLFPGILKFTRGQKTHWSPCLRTLDGHSDTVQSVAFSKDGKRIASGSKDKTIRIWDIETGTMPVGPLEGHTKMIFSVAFSTDSRYVASGSMDRTVCIWDVESGVAIKSLSGHDEPIFAVAFSSDGKHIASGSADRTVRIWDVGKGVAVHVWNGHEGFVLSVGFSPSEHRVVSGSNDCTLRLWDIKKSESILGPLRGHKALIRSVSFSPNGQRIVSASDDKTIRIWDSETGAPLFVPLTGHTHFVFCAAFSPTDSSRVVSGGDQTIRIWDVEAGTSIGEPLVGHNAIVNSAVFTPDERYIVSGSDDKTIRIWDVSAGAAMEAVRGHEGIIWSVAVSPNGRCIASGGADKTIRIWDVETGAMIGNSLDGHRDNVYSVAFSSDGRRVVSGSEDKALRIWDVETRVMVIGPLEGHVRGVISVSFSPDDVLLASGSLDNTIHIWDGKTGLPIKVLEAHDDPVCSIAFSSNNQHLASSSVDKTIHIWDIEAGSTINVLKDHSDAVFSIAFSPDGRRLISGSGDNTVRIWDLQTGQSVILPGGHTGQVGSVAFSCDGKRVISGSSDCSIRMWDADSCKLVVGPLEGHTNTVNAVTFLPDGRIVSSAQDQTIRIWTTETEKDVTNMLGGPTASAREEPANPLPPHSKPVIPRMMIPTTDQSVQVMDDCGWITQSGNVLLWVPADYRTAFVQPAMIIPTCNISVDFTNFLHGLSWVNIRG